MKTTHRAYSEEAGDFRLLCGFIIDHPQQMRTYTTWSLGRIVDWKYGVYDQKTTVPDFCERNAHLWFDAFDRLAGFVLSEDGGADIAILTLAGYRFLFAEMLDWALASWHARGALSIEITAHQTLETAVLEQRGFVRQAPFYTQPFDLTAQLPPRVPLEEGFSIVDMAAHPDYRAQRIMRDEAFGGRSDVSEAELQRELLFYGHSRRGPIYHPQTDLCVMAPDGPFCGRLRGADRRPQRRRRDRTRLHTQQLPPPRLRSRRHPGMSLSPAGDGPAHRLYHRLQHSRHRSLHLFGCGRGLNRLYLSISKCRCPFVILDSLVHRAGKRAPYRPVQESFLLAGAEGSKIDPVPTDVLSSFRKTCARPLFTVQS